MSKFDLTYKQLKEQAGIKGKKPSNTVIHRWIQFGLISCKKNYHSFYSNNSVSQLILCIKLTDYGKNIYAMRLLFDSYSIKMLSEKVGKITPNELNKLLQKVERKGK